MRTIPMISMMALATMAVPVAAQMPTPTQAPGAAPRRIVVVPPCVEPNFANWGRNHAGPGPLWLAPDPTPELLIGDTAYLRLKPIAAVTLAVPLGKPARPEDRGGLVTVRVATSGAYRIALGTRAWIDVARDGKPVASVAHQMGAACSGVAKLVDFRLEPGTYTIQLSAAADQTARIGIAKLP